MLNSGKFHNSQAGVFGLHRAYPGEPARIVPSALSVTALLVPQFPLLQLGRSDLDYGRASCSLEQTQPGLAQAQGCLHFLVHAAERAGPLLQLGLHCTKLHARYAYAWSNQQAV